MLVTYDVVLLWAAIQDHHVVKKKKKVFPLKKIF